MNTQEVKRSEEYIDISLLRSVRSAKLLELEQLSSELSLLKRELERIESILQGSEDSVLTADKIISMFEKSKHELPSLITKRLFEVEKFYESVIADRKNILIEQKENITLRIAEKTSGLDVVRQEYKKMTDMFYRVKGYYPNSNMFVLGESPRRK